MRLQVEGAHTLVGVPAVRDLAIRFEMITDSLRRMRGTLLMFHLTIFARHDLELFHVKAR